MPKIKNKPEQRRVVFTANTFIEIEQLQKDGYQLPRNKNPWLNSKEVGVRKKGIVWGWSQNEISEYTKCATDVLYFTQFCHIKSEDGATKPMKIRDYQEDVLLVCQGTRVINMSSRQSGKDQPLDALLWTNNGSIKMGDIKLNDKIFDETGNLTTVVGIYPQGEKDVYQITFADGSTVKCGYEHLWGVEDILGNYRVLSLKDILENKYLTNRGDYKYFVKTTQPVNYSKKELW